jgi:ATP-binding cassette subfamily B protein
MAKEKVKTNQQAGGFGRGGPIGAVEKPKQFGRTAWKLAKALKPHYWVIIFATIFTIASTIFAIISPKLLGNMTDQVAQDFIAVKQFELAPQAFPDGKPLFHYDALAEIAFQLLALYIGSLLANYIANWVLVGMIQRFVLKLRGEVSHKINLLPIKYFDNHQYGDLLSRVVNDIDTIAQGLYQTIIQLVSAVVTVIGILIMMLTISWQMTVVALIVLPLSLLFLGALTRISQKYFKAQQDGLGAMNGHIEETYAGQTIVKAFSGEEQAAQTFDATNRRLYGSAWKSQFLSGLMFPVMNLISNLGYVATCILGGYLAINGKVSIGGIQSFIQYVNQFNQPIAQTAQVMNFLQSTIAAAERVFEFLDEREEPDETALALPESVRAQGAVEFRDLCFSYEPGKPVIKHFSAKIKPGQQVAIVGPTGAGKTTIVNLLMRFYDPDSGEIRIDGTPINQITRTAVREQFGMVLQDTWLFSGTIMDNLRYGDTTATDAQVIKIAKLAHVDHFVRSLPHGYQTVLEEDSENISAGEKQLLTIARAMLANTPMMILDEATSSVDTRTEQLIQDAFAKLTHGRTSFVIAHRLSTIRKADLILVMRDGNIVEQGNHRELLAAGGFYTELYNSQFSEG